MTDEPKKKPPKRKKNGERALRPGPVDPPALLTRRQEQLRKLIISGRGTFSLRELGHATGTSSAVVWDDVRVVRALAPPPPLSNWDEARMIADALDFYDSALGFLLAMLADLCELEKIRRQQIEGPAGDQVERELLEARVRAGDEEAGREAEKKTFNPYSWTMQKVAVMNAIAVFRRDLNNFLLQTGLIKEAPLRLNLEDETLEKMHSAEQIKAGIQEIRESLRALRAKRAAAEKKAGS